MQNVLEKLGSAFLDLTETLVIGLSIFLVVYLFFMQPHQVNGQSMVPYFQNGDYLLTDKVSYRIGAPERGDVVVFHAPPAANCPTGTGCDFIKRILGVPGDQIEVKNNAIYLNGEKLDEDYIADDVPTEAGAFSRGKLIYLQPNEYFAVGDNRPHSSDSRAWGPITTDEIVGKVFFRYWPVDAMGAIHSATYPQN